MDFSSISLYLRQKCMTALHFHKDIEATLGPNAKSYSTVTKYRREAQITHDSEPTPTLIEDDGQKLTDKAILMCLPKSNLPPFGKLPQRC
jgi:hypothetical protein